ncbi:hypothetical protein HYQ44_012464 [Verticillium longisporum]|nr:hypothetical protein HYQ44_012464 [Verticillium longisporum]
MLVSVYSLLVSCEAQRSPESSPIHKSLHKENKASQASGKSDEAACPLKQNSNHLSAGASQHSDSAPGGHSPWIGIVVTPSPGHCN